MWVYQQNVGVYNVYWLTIDILICSSLSKVNKLCIINKIEIILPKVKSHNIQILNSKLLISSFNYLLCKKSS